MDSEDFFQFEQNNLFNILKANYNFDGLIHATPFANFLSILNDGYVAGRNDIFHNFSDIANQEVINITNDYVKNCARFYFYNHVNRFYFFHLSHPMDSSVCRSLLSSNYM